MFTGTAAQAALDEMRMKTTKLRTKLAGVTRMDGMPAVNDQLHVPLCQLNLFLQAREASKVDKHWALGINRNCSIASSVSFHVCRPHDKIDSADRAM